MRLQGLLKNKVACPSLGDFGGIFGGYLEEMWRTFGGFVEEIWRKIGGNLNELNETRKWEHHKSKKSQQLQRMNKSEPASVM